MYIYIYTHTYTGEEGITSQPINGDISGSFLTIDIFGAHFLLDIFWKEERVTPTVGCGQ